jgi:hypothetical protein
MALIMPAEAYELSRWAIRVGTEDPMPYLRDFALIDTDAIRDVGLHVWGGQDAGEHSPARTNLEAEAADLLKKLYQDLSPQWQDTQYDAFELHVEALAERMNLTASHFSTIGDVLIGIADEFEMRWYEIAGWVVSTAGLVVAAAGVVMAIVTFETLIGPIISLIVALIGLVVAAVGFAITYVSSVHPRLEELGEAMERLNEVAPPVRWLEPEVN